MASTDEGDFINAPLTAERMSMTEPPIEDLKIFPVDVRTLPGLRQFPWRDNTDGKVYDVLKGEEPVDSVHPFYVSDPGVVIICPPEDEYQRILTGRHWILFATDESIRRVKDGDDPEQVRSEDEKINKIENLRVGIAGLGTVGMNITATAVRVGFKKFSVAELPDERVENHNLNRLLPATQADLGKRKIDVTRREVALINPYAEFNYFGGIDRESALAFVDSCDVVISSLDNPEAMWWLHYYAHEQGKPVLLISDTGSGSTFDLYDYRDPETKIFNGRVSEEDIREGHFDKIVFDVMRHHILLRIPRDMLRFFLLKVSGNVDYLAQEAPSALLTSTFAIDALTRISTGEKMRKSSSVSSRRALDTWIQSIKRVPMRIGIIIEILREMKK
ncbi:ThiF family adenylyltransferase [Candidatus Dojkabacteria bacterium]|nr:ThiF family adenylyltransferase [Candidatus Dojkabacteria bacterium]